MKSSWFAVTFFVAAIVAATAVAISPATHAKAADSKSKLAARGEYLTTVIGCNDCHTPGALFGSPDFKRKLSGSEVGWQGPWGVSYPRNLTPDMETGIGKWSEKDIVTAIRTGTRADGSVLQPPMPWPMYSHLTDEDALAIATYLKSLPAVSHKAPDRVAPGQPVTGAVFVSPPPPAWDAPRDVEPTSPGGK